MPQQTYSDEELLEMLRRCAEKHGVCTPRFFNDMEGTCSSSTVMRRFGDWEDAKKQAGLDEDAKELTGRRKQYTDADVLRHIRQCADRNDGKATVALMQQEGDLVAPSVVTDRFGSWSEGKEEAGIKADERQDNHRPREYRDEDYIELLRECEEKHGKVTQSKFDEDEEFPSSGAVAKRFKSWSEAKELAGVGSDTKTYTDEELLKQIVECKRRHGKCSANEFADDDDFAAPETVQRRFGSWNDAKEKANELIEEAAGSESANENYEVENEDDEPSLAELREAAEHDGSENYADENEDDEPSLAKKREAAERGGSETPRTTNTTVTRHVRSREVKEYVLKRADGVCESCEEDAPFLKPPNGEKDTRDPYLETHHVDALSDGGRDKPDNVIALCPNCHARAHHGGNQEEYSDQLIKKVQQIEKDLNLDTDSV